MLDDFGFSQLGLFDKIILAFIFFLFFIKDKLFD